MLERMQSLAEAGHCLAGGAPGCGPQAGLAEEVDRLVPHLALAKVGAQREIVGLQVLGIQRLQSLADATVVQPALGREQLVVDDGLNPVVTEIEPLAHPTQEVAAHQLLDALRRRVRVEATRPFEEREVELAPDHRGHRGELARPVAQAPQSARDQVAHALGQRQRPGIRGNAAFLEGARRLDRDEGVPLAGGPDLLRQVRHRLRVAPGAGERLGEAPGVGTRQREQGQAPRVRQRAELLERATRGRGIGQLIIPGGHAQQEPPRRDPARDEGEQPQGHLVRPVEILQDDEDRLARGQAFQELGHALEEPELVVPGYR